MLRALLNKSLEGFDTCCTDSILRLNGAAVICCGKRVGVLKSVEETNLVGSRRQRDCIAWSIFGS